jgi:hypothetical protein
MLLLPSALRKRHLISDRAEDYVAADTRRGLLNDFDYAYADMLGKSSEHLQQRWYVSIVLGES